LSSKLELPNRAALLLVDMIDWEFWKSTRNRSLATGAAGSALSKSMRLTAPVAGRS
jgi:hypothetical protein